MVYIRRYLSGQQATTVTIAEGAITTDKITDKAVTQPKVADDAITSDKIADGTIEPADLKASAVETAKIKDGAVTTPKIADGAVTTQKLEASIQGIARPLTPGVASAEIAALAVVESKIGDQAVATAKIKDGNVSAAKLAADSVEEVKIKDGAVATAKIAGGAVTETKLGANSVTGSKIAPAVVSVTELADNSVESAKIKDFNVVTDKINPEAVTAAKLAENSVTSIKLDTAALAKRHLSSKRVRILDVDEKFVGGVVPNGWQAVMDVGGSVRPTLSGGLYLYTGALIGDKINLSGGPLVKALEGLPIFDAQVRREQTTDDIVFVGAEDALGNRIGFERDLALGTNHWWARCDYADGAVNVDTGEVATHDIFWLLGFEVVNATTVKFYLDGLLVATIVSTVPANKPLFPVLEIETIVNSNRILWARYLSLVGDRD